MKRPRAPLHSSSARLGGALLENSGGFSSPHQATSQAPQKTRGPMQLSLNPDKLRGLISELTNLPQQRAHLQSSFSDCLFVFVCMRRFRLIMQSVPKTWTFAPLSRPYAPGPSTRRLEGIVFDVDGTLW